MKNRGSGFIAWLAKSTIMITVSLTVVGISASSSLAVLFPIATNGAAQGYSFDGSNYLIGIQYPQTMPRPTIGAQMISSSGTKVGAPISTGRSGIATNIAFDGTNYLLIWEDDNGGAFSGSTGWQIWGQFISKAGMTVNSPFPVSSTGIWFDGVKTMAFGSGKYLVTYTKLIVPANGSNSNNRYIAGRIVNPNGTMGDEFRISANFGDASDVAFDGTNFFVIWREDSLDQEVRGRFVSPSGALVGSEISVNASPAPSDNSKSVTFDGTNYLVVWNDEVGGAGSGEWNVFGQLVSPAGALVGGVITITSEPGPQIVTTVAFDGSNYLAAWMDMTKNADWDMYGQYIRKNGSLVGNKITISTDATNQMGGVGFLNGKYLVLINSGVIMGEGGVSQVDAAYGTFIYPPSQFTASGTYTYLPAASATLTYNLTSSNFVCSGPSFGENTETVTSITATSMTWAVRPNGGGMSWTRVGSGADGVITGTWSATDPTSGNTYIATFNADGTLLVSADIFQCNANGPLGTVSFSPASGKAGDLVTISGGSYSPLATNNTVLFNGVPAVVTGVRPNELSVLVPPGATTGFISVSNSGGTVTSSAAFTVTAAPPAATLAWGGVHHRIDADGLEYDALDAGLTSYATTLSGMTLAVTGPNSFSYTFTDADTNQYINGRLTAYKRFLTPATPLAAGVYTFTLNDGQGHTSHRVDTHVTATGPLQRVDSSTIQLQRKSDGSYRISWAPLNDTHTYNYRLRISRNDSTDSPVYDSTRNMLTHVDVPAGILFDDSMYKLRVEAGDSPNGDLVTNRSDSTWKLFSPRLADYNPGKLMTNFAAVNNRTDGTSAQAFEAVLSVGKPDDVTSLTLTGPASFTYTFNLSTDVTSRTDGTTTIKDFYKSFSSLATGLYTFTYQTSAGGAQTAFATLTAPVTYPIVDSSTMQAQDLGNGNTRFSWANVNHSGALYYRVALNNQSVSLFYTTPRQNLTFVDIPTSIITNLVPNRWRVEVFDSGDVTTQRNRFNTAFKSLTVPLPAFDATAPMINSISICNLKNPGGAAYAHIAVNATAPRSTLTQILVTGPGGYSQDVLAVGRYYPVNNAYVHEVPGTLASGLYTVTVTDTTGKSARGFMYAPAAHALPRTDFKTFYNDLEPNGDMRISWAPVVSDVPVWYSFWLFAATQDQDGDGLVDLVYEGNNAQQSSFVIPAATLLQMPHTSFMAEVMATDGSDFSVINNASQSVIFGAESPGTNDYATLADTDNDGFASNIDPNDFNPLIPAVYPFYTANDGLATAVIGTSPLSGASGISTSGNISVSFNKVIDQRTLPASFSLNNGATGALTYNPDTRTATFIPTPPLLTGTTYTATLSTSLRDQAGNYLSAPYTWNFTTSGSLPTLSVTIVGGGNVSSDSGSPGIHGTEPGTYSSTYPWNSPVTLTASQKYGFDFSGWGGDGTCAGNTLTCDLFMTSQTRNVTATFTEQKNIKNGANFYGTLASALQPAALANNDELRLKSFTFVEDPVFNVPGMSVSMKGGFIDTLFTDDSGTSVISGKLTIQSGTLTVRKIAIK
ncbi:MAG: Ig-like domain-containing protein [Desulfuromonadales bacterium]|nr:Ig-like domain-containing protein [Desulfuromonadales bacterium]